MNTIEHLLKASRENSKEISMASPEMKNQVLLDLANLLEANTTKIILANQKDLDQMDAQNPMRDRLLSLS